MKKNFEPIVIVFFVLNIKLLIQDDLGESKNIIKKYYRKAFT